MQRLISIFLILVFLNYIAGYYVLFWVLKNQADVEMTQKLDAGEYSNSETVTFKFPFTLPYNRDMSSFERVDGSFQLNGQYFKLVKQKLAHDTLYIVCIRDYSIKTITTLLADFVKVSNGLVANCKIIKSVASFAKDYQTTQLNVKLLNRKSLKSMYSRYDPFNILSTCIDVPYPPPKA